jgi:hypothetical protein
LGVAVVGIAGMEEVQVVVRSLGLRMTDRDSVVVLVAAHTQILMMIHNLEVVQEGSDTSHLVRHCVVAVEGRYSRHCWIVDVVGRVLNLKPIARRP